MTEPKWLAATDPIPMLDYLEDRGSERKLRLFAVACCRRIAYLLFDGRSQAAVDVAERHADGRAEEDEVAAAGKLAEEAAKGHAWDAKRDVDTFDTLAMAATAARNAVLGTMADRRAWVPSSGTAALMKESPVSAACLTAAWAEQALEDRNMVPRRNGEKESAGRTWDNILQSHADLVRDIFGNPFVPVTLDPSWLTSTVLALAEGIYGNRDYSLMPILADALQEAGCENELVLNHCRSENLHVRGCWVVDLLLGKE